MAIAQESPVRKVFLALAILGGVAFVVGFGGVLLDRTELVDLPNKDAANLGLLGFVGFVVGLPSAAIAANTTR